MPSSSSCSTVSGLLMSFFIAPAVVSAWVEGIERHRSEDSADDRPDDRHPRVAPVRGPLAGYRQDRVGDAWREVARRVDRISRRPTEGQADHEDEEAHKERGQPAVECALVGEDREDA